MILNDTHRFAFVHIPKCAGSTVRNALAPFDEHADMFLDKGVSDHPALGMLDHPHIPLAVLREHFAEAFEKLAAYRSFALVRNPFTRFPSSLHERFVQRDGKALSQRDPAEVAREVDIVLETLARYPKNTPITDPAFIHFSRQRDYVFCDGVQIVKTPRPVEQVDALLRDLTEIVGQPVRPEESRNKRLSYASTGLERVQLAVTRPIEAVLPRWIWKPVYKPIKQAFLMTGLLRSSANPLDDLPNRAEIDDFIREFYADDIALYDALKSSAAERT